MVTLAKGQSISLEKKPGEGLTRVVMGLGWDVRKKGGLFGGGRGADIDLDASCLMFDSVGHLVDSVWFRQLTSKDGSIVHTGDNLTGAGEGDDEQIKVDLTRVPLNIQTLIFTVNSFRGDTFDRVANAYCRVIDETTRQEKARYNLSASGVHTAQVMAKVTRDGGGWMMTAIGSTTTGRTFHDMMPAISSAL